MSQRVGAIRKMFRHAESSRKKLLRAAKSIDKESFLSRRKGLSSIRDLQVHLMDTEDYWVGSVIMGERRRKFSPEKYEDAASLEQDWNSIRQRTRDFLSALSEQVLSDKRTVEWDRKLTFEVDEVLWQLLTHELHHNGQICLLMRETGHQAPELDIL
ncbi:MAG: hypothetical protein AMJ46_02895 [Latescibacteria bacterium DG_63]|nr:MAG: hypothetical protein AMJ46_02895 [Latescibacteria bacterium DG_63]